MNVSGAADVPFEPSVCPAHGNLVDFRNDVFGPFLRGGVGRMPFCRPVHRLCMGGGMISKNEKQQACASDSYIYENFIVSFR